MNSLCSDCQSKKAEYEKNRFILTGCAGWCVPVGDASAYPIWEPGCFVGEKPSKRKYLRYFLREPWKWRSTLALYREEKVDEGVVFHGFSSGVEFPDFQVKRGGIRFGKDV